jgi:hypothetical protein
MKRRRNRRYLKKRLRFRENQLGRALSHFTHKFDSHRSLEDEHNFRPLLKLRWLINDFIYLRLKLHPLWMKKQWFLELLDVDSVEVRDGKVVLHGDAAWWAQGADATGEWWPSDHEAHQSSAYRVKLGGDLAGGRWVLEPVKAELEMPRRSNQKAKYRIEFGQGSTYMAIKGGR